MRRLPIYLLLAIVVGTLSSTNTTQAASVDTATVFSAMRDELNRSMGQLRLENLAKPYFIQYNLRSRTSYDIAASFGSLVESTHRTYNSLSVQVRVGDYTFDNSNFFDVGLSFFGSSDDEESFKNRTIAAAPTYGGLRRQLWLTTDAAYKQAVELYAKKQAVLENKVRIDTTHDFLSEYEEGSSDLQPHPKPDIKAWEKRVVEISSVAKEFPFVTGCKVNFEFLPTDMLVVNSEGVAVGRTDFFTGLEITVMTVSKEGMPLAQTWSTFAPTPASMPNQDHMVAAVRSACEKLEQQLSVELIEPYSGPVLFEGQAAAQVFAQAFAPNLATQRQPLSDGGFSTPPRFSAFQNKIGGRVLPEFLQVKAEPKARTLFGTPTLGYLAVDDEGVQSEDVSLVEAGYLKNLLSSRVPTRRVRESNGHNRGGAAMLSNIVVQPIDSAEHVATKDSLVQRMMQLCADRELEYGIVVRNILDRNMLFTSVYGMSNGEYPFTRDGAALPLVAAYKVYADGREELLRGAEIRGIAAQSFKDIILSTNDIHVLNYLAPAISSPFVTGGPQYLGATVCAPDVLFEDLEIGVSENEFSRPPLIENPLTESK